MTLAELQQIQSKGVGGAVELLDKITGAVMVAAEVVRTESTGVTNHTNRLIWAKQAFQDPVGKANQMWPAVLAANSSSTQSAVLAAGDSAINTNVQAAIDIFATGA
jgi:hypothetical protein